MKKTICLAMVLTLGLIMDISKADFTFGESTNLGLSVNSSAEDVTPSISSDGLELYFCSDRPGGKGGYDIWVTTRATTDDPWGEPVNLGPTVNSSYSENSPSISADGLALYFNDWPSPRPGGLGSVDIWVTTRPTKDDDWGEPVNLGPTVNGSGSDGSPAISDDGLSLFFSSNRPGGYGNLDLWVTTRVTTEDDWGPPVNLGPMVNSSAGDCCPSISHDGRTLFFGSTARGSAGYDLWMTTRANVSDPWGEPVRLGQPVSVLTLDDGPSISADGATLFFFSNRSGGIGSYDMWQVSLSPIVDFNGDGKADSTDICIMADYWQTDEPLCDISLSPLGDGIVDASDMLVLTEYIAKERVDNEADIAAVEHVLLLYDAAMKIGDFELWLSLHADDVVKMPPDEPAIFGKEQLRASMKPLFDNFTFEVVMNPEEAKVDGDMGLARGTYTLSIIPKAGGESIFVDGKYLTICKRQADGSWKISHDCFNSNVPSAH